MKIVYLTNGSINSKAAYTVNVASMCQAFSSLGHDVTLLVPNKNNENLNAEDYFNKFGIISKFNIKIFGVLKLPIINQFFFIWQGAKQAKKIKPDILFVRFWYDYLILLFYKENVIIERHITLENNKKLYFLQKKILQKKNLKKVVLITGALKKMYVSKLPELENKFCVFSDGANLIQVKNNTTLKGKYSINIGYTGHLYKGRGIDVIIKLANLNTNMGFHLIGGIEEDVNIWKEEAKSLSNVFFYGHVPHFLVSEYAVKMDVLLAPYQLEVKVKGGSDTVNWMSPLKIFEYMAYKKPFLCSRISVLEEVLVNNFNCLLCKPGDISDWQVKLQYLVNNKDKASLIANNAYNDLVNNYTWIRRAEKILH